ncbi:MAG: exodeoxyribonuclease V subunit gamma, partial [Planctomycetota bacterium]|nr:exodeoxyribonuclease V subunit gamma [Planctomycetota bacterium]
MLKLHTSNRLETLARRLAEATQRPLRSVLQPELVMVQSQGMARWLKLELAERHGVCANYAFPFPKVFCSQVLGAHGGRARHSVRAADDLHGAHSATPPALGDETSLLDREVMLWEIMRVLPEMLDQPEFSPLKSYLSDAADIRKRFQLASQIANLFDQYLVFRPDLILAWDQGQLKAAGAADSPHELWQAALWRRLQQEKSGQHLAALLKEFAGLSAKPDFKPQDVPERISIFGISALPPSYLQVFCALGARIDV